MVLTIFHTKLRRNFTPRVHFLNIIFIMGIFQVVQIRTTSYGIYKLLCLFVTHYFLHNFVCIPLTSRRQMAAVARCPLPAARSPPPASPQPTPVRTCSTDPPRRADTRCSHGHIAFYTKYIETDNVVHT